MKKTIIFALLLSVLLCGCQSQTADSSGTSQEESAASDAAEPVFSGKAQERSDVQQKESDTEQIQKEAEQHESVADTEPSAAVPDREAEIIPSETAPQTDADSEDIIMHEDSDSDSLGDLLPRDNIDAPTIS